MKYFNRTLLFVILAGLIMAPQTAQVNSYVNGNVLTADQLNSEFGNLYSTINALDEDNFLSTTAFPPSFITAALAGDGLSRDVNGVLSVNTDGATLETNADTLRIKDAGVTTAKLAADQSIGFAAGSVGTPSIRFTGDSNTGVYSPGAHEIGVVNDGTRRFTFARTHLISTFAGSAADPVYQMDSANSGIYAPATSAIGISTGGALRFTFANTHLLSSFNGSAADPVYQLGSTNVGLYAPSSTSLGFAVSGNQRFGMTATHLVSTFQGSAGEPVYQMDSANAGVYAPSASSVGLAGGGSNLATFSSSGLNILGDGAFKVKICTGTIAGAGTASCSVTGSIVGVSGWTEKDNANIFVPLESTVAAGVGNDRNIISNSTSVSVNLTNDHPTLQNDYSVTIIYQ